MITTIASVPMASVADWQECLRISPLLLTPLAGRVASVSTVVAPVNPNRLSLPDLNVIQSTIVCSDGTPVLSYRPFEGDQQISDVVMAAPPAAGATFAYTALQCSLRGIGTFQKDSGIPMGSPRVYVVHAGSVRILGDQIDDNGNISWYRKLYIQMIVDTDDKTGGPVACSNLVGLIENTISQQEALLDQNGYEFVRATSSTINVPGKDGGPPKYRGIIMVSSTIHPTVF